MFQCLDDLDIVCLCVSVFGCPDIEVPVNAWYKRDGQTASVGCNSNTWNMICNGTQWAGSIGECPIVISKYSLLVQREDPYGIFFLIQ